MNISILSLYLYFTACRSNRRFGLFKKSARELLPTKPIGNTVFYAIKYCYTTIRKFTFVIFSFSDNIPILPWWYVQVAYITEEDMKTVDKAEHCLIDQIIDNGTCPAGYLNYQIVKQLLVKGFIYFDVPVEDEDHVMVILI